jgi:UDP-N-acetylglucosamine acyltransferase
LTIGQNSNIHPTAIVHPAAVIAGNAVVGPYCIIGENVTLGALVVLTSHVCVSGWTTIGARTRVAPFASIGGPPQSTGYRGEKTKLLIGDDCDIREYVTISTGTVSGGGQTTIGDRVMLMAYCHIGHDSAVGNDVIFANNASLGGHCVVGNRVFMGAFSGCHQFIRIGEGAMVGGMIGIREDVIPFGLVDRTGHLGGVNIVGLKRRGALKSDLQAIRSTVNAIFKGDGSFETRKQRAFDSPPENLFAAAIVSFIAEGGKRPLMKFAMVTAAEPHNDDD